MSVESLRKVKTLCEGVLERWRGRGIAAVYLYGSTLGAWQRPDSDVDIAVLDLEERPLNWTDQSKLMDELERALGRAVDLRMVRDCVLSLQAHIFDRGELVFVELPTVTETYVQALRRKYESQEGNRRAARLTTIRELTSGVGTHDEPRLPR